MKPRHLFLWIALVAMTYGSSVTAQFASPELPDSTDPKLAAIILDARSLSPHYRLATNRVVSAPLEYRSRPERYAFIFQEWRLIEPSPGVPERITFEYGYFPDPTHFKQAWTAFRNTTSLGLPALTTTPGSTIPMFGDLTRGSPYGYRQFAKDYVICGLSYSGQIDGDPDAFATELTHQLLARIEAQDFPTLPPMEAQFDLVSTSMPVEVAIEASSPYVLSADYQVVAQGTPGSYVDGELVIENGTARVKITEALAPDDYLLSISVVDDLGRRKDFEHRFTVSQISPPQPSSHTLLSSKDALIYERSPHSNEGANPRLTLEKITGKAARNLIGFDLSAVNTPLLSRATLVLSIDPSNQVTGWGNGEGVSVRPLIVDWSEGNGRSHGLLNNQQSGGSGSGATWFSPVDENISNNTSNSTTLWNGASSYASPRTALSQVIQNHQTGEVRFDVTTDLRNGATKGWLLSKDAENKGSKVSFYSKEGAIANGSPSLAPRLILEYSPIAGLDSRISRLARLLGLPVPERVALQLLEPEHEDKSLRTYLQQNSNVAVVTEQVILGLVGTRPLTRFGVQAAYRSWLRGEISLV